MDHFINASLLCCKTDIQHVNTTWILFVSQDEVYLDVHDVCITCSFIDRNDCWCQHFPSLLSGAGVDSMITSTVIVVLSFFVFFGRFYCNATNNIMLCSTLQHLILPKKVLSVRNSFFLNVVFAQVLFRIKISIYWLLTLTFAKKEKHLSVENRTEDWKILWRVQKYSKNIFRNLMLTIKFKLVLVWYKSFRTIWVTNAEMVLNGFNVKYLKKSVL